jgi:glycosyltransferase involved in cell wall biosynthesis
MTRGRRPAPDPPVRISGLAAFPKETPIAVRARKRVLLIEGQIKHYRLSLYEKLYEALKHDGVDLRVAYSDPSSKEVKKRDAVDLPPEYGVKVKAHWLCGERLVYQSMLREVLGADLVIAPQANRHLLNYPLLCFSALGMKKVAFGGHGKNRQSLKDGLSERLKRHTLTWVDWWFTYTAGTADYLVRHGFPESRITNLQNSVDTTAFREQLAGVSDSELTAVRRELGIPEDSKVGLFCGGVTREKLPELLVRSAVSLRERLPQFELLALGAGPEQVHFELAAQKYPWFHYLGPRFGRQKAPFFKLSDVFLIPGAVGLAILDAFAAGLPIISTDVPIHGPEIEYLEEGQNGLMTACDVEDYAGSVARLLTDSRNLHALQVGALAAATKYSVETTVANFRRGILQCLGKCAVPTIAEITDTECQ